MSAGRHGLIARRMNGQVRITVRPKASVLKAEDMAMILGKVLDISDGGYNDDMSRADTIQRIWDWEHSGMMPIKLTQKQLLAFCTDVYRLSQYENGNTSWFDGDLESHQVLLEFIHDRFPKFRQIEATMESEEE